MNFENIKALLSNDEEVIRMEQSLYVGKNRPLDILTVPFDDFSDVCRTLEETENQYEGMPVTILNKKNNYNPQYTIRLKSGIGIENWKLTQAGIFDNSNSIINTFRSQIVEDKSYPLYRVVPIGFEFLTSDKLEDDIYRRYVCIGYDDMQEKIKLAEIKPIMASGSDLM